ncbi:PIG-L deacetylase family protein [Nocardia sp. Marseille-Q1738]
MNVLAVIAHPDDEILGCGATLRLLADQGHRVVTCVLSGEAEARHARPDSARLRQLATDCAAMIGVADARYHAFGNIQLNTVPHLDLVKAIEAAIIEFEPEWVFTHHPGDLNIDHRVCWEATMAAIMLPQRLSTELPLTLIKKVFLFEVPSSTDWAPAPFQAFQPNAYFDVTRSIETKLAALRAFEGALKPHPHARSEQNVRSLAGVRGGAVGVAYAEAFVLTRDLYLDRSH